MPLSLTELQRAVEEAGLPWHPPRVGTVAECECDWTWDGDAYTDEIPRDLLIDDSTGFLSWDGWDFPRGRNSRPHCPHFDVPIHTTDDWLVAYRWWLTGESPPG